MRVMVTNGFLLDIQMTNVRRDTNALIILNSTILDKLHMDDMVIIHTMCKVK
jgi:hypothetical protein